MFTVVSLFSGAMGLDIGIEKTGRFNFLACVEKVPAICETIRCNRDAGRISNREFKVYEVDICKLDPVQVLADLGLKPGELDLLVGGPPCQSFSTTGRRGTIQDHRGTLLWQFLRFIDAMQPKFFLMENVRGLMSAALRHRPIAQRPEKGGPPLMPDEEPGSVVKQFISDLHGAYRLDCFEVNAVNYGSPQLRERALFIGNRFNRLVEFPNPTHGPITAHRQLTLSGEISGKLKPFTTLGDALANLVEEDPLIMDFSPRKKRYLAMVPPGGNWRCLPPEVAQESMGKAYFAKGGRSGWWRRLSFDLPCPTIVTMPNHSGTALCHPTEVRALSLRECARIQEFPDEWEFCGKLSEQYAQVGNAVPVRLGKVSGELLASHLDELYANGMISAPGTHPVYRTVYVKSHIRTRQWYKDGQEFIWQDGADNQHVFYGSAKTLRKERTLTNEETMAKRKNNADQLGLDLEGGLTDADLYSVLRKQQNIYDPRKVANLFEHIDEDRTMALANLLMAYIKKNLPEAIDKRKNLADYRTNPYVLLTSANVLKLSDPKKFGTFLFNSKLYAGLETSFGKSIEAAFVSHYPIVQGMRGTWEDPQEKVAEFAALKAAKLSREQKARARNNSVWREIDKSCIVNDRRYLVTIKSGPNCINDTQVAGMVTAIKDNYLMWVQQTQQNYPEVTGLDVVIGITYGTELTTNNKENQILAKLQEHGFMEEDRARMPGVLIDRTGTVRVYRCIGQGFWSFIGNPSNPAEAPFVFLEVLLALCRALSQGMKEASLEERVNLKLTQLANALLDMRFPRAALPNWIREDFSEDELFWLATAMTAFYDTGI